MHFQDKNQRDLSCISHAQLAKSGYTKRKFFNTNNQCTNKCGMIITPYKCLQCKHKVMMDERYNNPYYNLKKLDTHSTIISTMIQITKGTWEPETDQDKHIESLQSAAQMQISLGFQILARKRVFISSMEANPIVMVETTRGK